MFFKEPDFLTVQRKNGFVTHHVLHIAFPERVPVRKRVIMISPPGSCMKEGIHYTRIYGKKRPVFYKLILQPRSDRMTMERTAEYPAMMRFIFRVTSESILQSPELLIRNRTLRLRIFRGCPKGWLIKKPESDFQ